MSVNLGLQLVLVITVLVIPSGDARSKSEVHLHDDVNVGCEPTKCPKFCTGGYYYFYEGNERCLKCKCGKPKGLDDCSEDINPSLCDSVDISEECQKNPTVRQSCNFSCSQSGQLWWAAIEGNLTEVNTAIAAGANPLCERKWTHFHFGYLTQYNFNMTALHLAAWFNHPEVIVALLNNGVDVNLQTTEGATPAYYASFNESIDALRVLIEHNAYLDIATFDKKWTPLTHAAAFGKLSVVKTLINANASLDITRGWRNATALYWAVRGHERFGHPDVVYLLIEHNADVNIPASSPDKGHTPLMEAVMWGELSIVKALINANANLDFIGGQHNSTALHWAAMSYRGGQDSEDKALLLLQGGADTTILDKYGRTAAELAKRYGRYQVAELIESYSKITTTTIEYIVTSFSSTGAD